MAETNIATDQVITDAEATGRSYLATWLETAGGLGIKPPQTMLLELLVPLTSDPSATKGMIEAILGQFAKALAGPDAESDLAEDMAAWRELTRDIAGHIGRNAPLDQFLQELQLRSKEPTPKPETVTLMTIHGAKGREFDFVYVIGLAEDVIPSFQSRQKGDRSPEMEEERRNCFVAITRTKECLVLSRAERYKGWQKQPSRFLVEMGLVS
jgi:DNA helicase-2/ATP-dependent DNA helicase PcrA